MNTYTNQVTGNKNAIEGISVDGHGVEGNSKNSEGVVGNSTNNTGVLGESDKGVGVSARSKSAAGVWAYSETFEGVHAETDSMTNSAVAAIQLNAGSQGAALYAKHVGGGTAAFFDGNVIVTGDVSLSNADCAEDFDIADAASVEPGTVMVLGDDEGTLYQSQQPYDKRVAGVVSGAGDYKPGIVLDKQQSQSGRKPIALLGKVYCKVDADYAPIEVGDLLTTSASPGYAMKAFDPLKAFGAVIGKALRPLKEGQGLIPILIALQ